MSRASGVLMHISSLPGEYSIGTFGKEAKSFIDFLASCGFSYWQVLPFGMVDECNSPYKSYSAFGGNPFFIDPKILFEQGLITSQELENAKQKTPYSCEFERLRTARMELFLTASKRLCDRSKVLEFIESRPYIKQCCEFMSLKDANNQAEWTEWTVNEPDSDVLFMWYFIQYEFFRQWKLILDYAHSKGVKIIGDIPIYVAYDSSDVWGNKDLFLLDDDFKPTDVAGVPPDYFSADGQLWGNPLYDWEKMKADGYSWWKARLQNMFALFDGVRIDHFRGLASYWSVPASAKTAKEGRWVKGPGKDFIDMINSISDENFVIAEDLGDITPDVIDLVKYSGFPGMRVFQFGFLSDCDSPHQPHNYPENCIAYTGTHDNNTLLGYVWELSEESRKGMLEYCGYFDKNWDACYDRIIATMMASHAGTVIFPIQDLLKYGSDTRINRPGQAEGNWTYRLTKEQLNSLNCQYYKRLNYLYRR